MMKTMAVEPHLDAWLSVLHERDGTDILLTHGSPPLLRVDGKLAPLEGEEPLSGADIEKMARAQFHHEGVENESPTAGGPAHFAGELIRPGHESDFAFSWRDLARIRANAFYQRGHCSLSLRRIPMRIPSPGELGVPEVLASILRSPSGMILVTG